MNVDEIRVLKEQVEYCLVKYPDTRNSDKLLTWSVWMLFHGVEHSVTKEQFMQLPTEDHIRRVRAHIQNIEKLYIPTDWKVAEQRNWIQNEWRRSLGYFVGDDNQVEMVL